MKKIILMCLMALVSFGYAEAQKPQKSNKKVTTTTVFMTDIDCAGCAKKVNDTIPYEKGVKDVKVDVDAKTVTVTFDPAKTNNETLVKAFGKVKINAQPQGECAGKCCEGHDHKAEAKKCDDACCEGHDHGHDHKHNHGHNHSH